ncbi:MAG: ABC transporter permease subunit [Lentisphaeria bacterium]|nr:ABC transporter permease subunit [Lentisphaeria bacterium]
MGKIFAIAKLSVLELFRKKDVYVAIVLALVAIVPLAVVNAFGIEGAVRYIREVALLLVWGFSVIICVTTSARQIPNETQRKTILPLLAKPVSRAQIALGKTLGSIIASWGALAMFYGCYIVIAGLKSGIWIEPVLLQSVILHACFAALACSMTVCGSLALTPSANITACLLIIAGGLLFGDHLPDLINKAPGLFRPPLIGLEYVLPRFELFDLRARVIHSHAPVPAGVFLFILLYGAAYSAVFMGLAAGLFKRKQY